jgi:indolepyruvate ferredoxin oxidoreductase alpha subunit
MTQAGRELMMGNEAMARALVENGCSLVTAYPGTPSSEILAAVARYRALRADPMHVQWAVNEKVAFEIAYAGSQAGLRTAVAMKQVGLNVAADPLMSAAYMGTVGGFVVISADDPGPHSSQTEQDSRMMAMMAKIPVLDPDSPRQAHQMVGLAYAISESYRIPVMLRPTTRVCHSRQDLAPGPVLGAPREPAFQKDPLRWAATPKFRSTLHGELEAKLARIAADPSTAPVRLNPGAAGPRALVASGVAAAHVREALAFLGLQERLAAYQVRQPFPLHPDFIAHLMAAYDEILVLEETTGIIELQLARRDRVRGKQSGHVSRVGELSPETIVDHVADFAGLSVKAPRLPAVPGRRPTLCAGCPHRASFFAIKKAAPKGIYTSDIGCYTLGLNLGAVDTVLCMGAAISQAAGFCHAFRHTPKPPPVVATIGDSTFFHAGVPALIDTVTQQVPFVLVILDNRTTAMTGNQPTAACGTGAGGEPLQAVDLESLVDGCGVRFRRTADPYDLKGTVALLREALVFARENGPAVVICRRPCLLDRSRRAEHLLRPAPTVSPACDGCGFCVAHFECPALVAAGEKEPIRIDAALCSGCHVCVAVCPKNAILAVEP